jgi:hypothetical protein
MSALEICVLGFMIMALPIAAITDRDNPAWVATQEFGDQDERSHP